MVRLLSRNPAEWSFHCPKWQLYETVPHPATSKWETARPSRNSRVQWTPTGWGRPADGWRKCNFGCSRNTDPSGKSKQVRVQHLQVVFWKLSVTSTRHILCNLPWSGRALQASQSHQWGQHTLPSLPHQVTASNSGRAVIGDSVRTKTGRESPSLHYQQAIDLMPVDAISHFNRDEGTAGFLKLPPGATHSIPSAVLLRNGHDHTSRISFS